MKIFQGWKVKFYIFVTFFLFVTGATAALWPHNTATFSQNHTHKNSSVQNLDTTKKEVKDNETVKNLGLDNDKTGDATNNDENAGQTPSTTVPADKKTGDPIIVPAPTSIPVPDPVKPVINPPVIKPPVTPPTRCGGCVVIQKVGSLLCPLTGNNLLGGYPCKLEY